MSNFKSQGNDLNLPYNKIGACSSDNTSNTLAWIYDVIHLLI